MPAPNNSAFLEAERRNLEIEKQNFEQEKKLEEYKRLDEAERLASHDWKPAIQIDRGKNVTWASWEIDNIKGEVALDYVASIVVFQVGSEPGLQYSNFYSTTGIGQGIQRYAYPATPASILITTHAGLKSSITISRHKLDAMLGELLKAWRRERAL